MWFFLSKLEFNYLNDSEDFIIKYKDNGLIKEQKFQIFAFDEEVILLFICATSKNDGISTIQNIRTNKYKIENEIVDKLSTSPKISWIFASNNFTLTEEQKIILDNNKIHYFNDSDLSYYEKLHQNLGIGAKYQFYGKIFCGKSIPELKNRVPAIKGKMGGHDYYSFSISPESLLKISYVLHRISNSDDTIQTYQRMIKKKRIDEITKFIDDNDKKTGSGFFPNSIIVNIDTKKSRPLKFDLSQSAEKDVDTSIGILHLPNSYRSAFIIDGQHRLYGYANSKFKTTNTIPVIAFENLPAEIQTDLFVDINSKQKAVSSTLLQILDSELKWGSKKPEIAEKALKSRLVQKLGESKDSPLFNKIKLSPETTSKEQYLTLTYFINYGLNKTKFFVGNKKINKIVEYGYLYDGDLAEKTLQKSYEFLKFEFEFLISILPEQWSKGNDKDGFIAKNIGVTAFVVLINDILKYELDLNNRKYQELSALGIYNITKSYIEIVLEGIKVLSPDKLKDMSKYYGAGGVEKVRRELQIILNKKINEFSPEGLSDYIKTTSGKYVAETNDFISSLQKLLNKVTIIVLKNEFGEDDWWDDGVPEKIRLECTAIYVKEKRVENEWNYLMLINYKEIALNNWKLFDNIFTPPKQTSAKKGDRVSWFNKMNKIRNKCFHPERSDVKEEEYIFIKTLSEWLKPRLLEIINNSDYKD